MEDLKQKKKIFMDNLGIVILGIMNSDILFDKDIDLIYNITKGLKKIIREQEKNKISKEKLKLLDDEWKKLIQMYGLVKIYNKKKKGDLINLWNEIEGLYKIEQSLES